MSDKPTYEELEQRIQELEKWKAQHNPAVEKLKHSNKLLETVIETVPAGIIGLDLNGHVQFVWNQTAEKMLGWNAREVMGKPLPTVPKDRQDEFKRFREQIRNGMTLDGVDVKRLKKDGTPIDYSIYATPLYDTDGCISGNIAVLIDITERKQAEEELRGSEDKFRHLIDSSPIGISLTYPNGKMDANDAFYQMLGYSQDEFQNLKWQNVTHPDDYKLSKQIIDSLLSGKKESDRLVKRYIHKNGSTVWADVSTKLRRDDAGDPVYFITAINDITDRKLAQTQQAEIQRELVQRNQFIEMILDSLPIGLGVNYVDSGEVTYLNKKFQEIYGWPKDDLQNIADFFDRVFPDPKKREAMKEMIIDDISSGDPDRMVWDGLEITTKNNKKKIVSAINIPIFDQNLMISTVQDQTEKRKLEAQIQQVQKMEAIGRLAGGVAHDFNNMLSLIIGHADMALDDVDRSSPLHEVLLEIRKAGERSANLTRQLLAFARKETISPKVLDLNKTIEGMTRMLQSIIGENIDLKWLPGKKIWPVMMDPSQIDQILANLCVNARDAITGIGNITIETATSEFDESYCAEHPGFVPGEYVLLTVGDNGCGMDTETMTNIFEPFFTTKGPGKGTGLGLAMVYGVVKQNNGFISVYSEPGQGTIFKIYLPRFSDKAEPLIEKQNKIPAQSGHETILLVEDEEAILKMATRLLERQGYNILAAKTPSQAIRKAQENVGKIHLLITDVVMPEMNGQDLAKKILAINPNLKHLFMSGYTADVIAHHGVLDKGVNFIQKPFSMEQISVKVRSVLDGA